MIDWKSYIGLPFAKQGRSRQGVDCWGLVYIFYKEVFGIELPTYTDAYTDPMNRQEVQNAFEDHAADLWNKIPPADAQPGDCILFSIHTRPIHVGIMIDAIRFLHVQEGIDSVIERITSERWNKRIEGVYRLRSLGSSAASI